jgi:hypothetical protein
MRILTSLIVLAIAVAAGTASAARLKDKPPEGVNLKGTWKLDPNRSDDPAQAIDRAVRTATMKDDRGIDEWSRSGRIMDDDDWDDYGRNDDWRRGTADRRPGDVRHRDRSTTIDPLGREASVTWGTGSAQFLQSELLALQLDPNPGTLTILDWGNRLSVSEDKLETVCTAGQTEPIADAFGDGERRCGWNGRTWIIETKRPRRFTRVDRFELSRDGKSIIYTTAATGPRIPSIKISRTYTLVPPG